MPTATAYSIARLVLSGTFLRHPKLKLCFAHGAGCYPSIAARVAHGHQVRPDLCAIACTDAPTNFHGRIYADSLVHDPQALRLLLHIVGKDRVVYGSVYPFPLGELETGKAVETCNALTQTEKDDVLWRNAINMFGLNEETFETR